MKCVAMILLLALSAHASDLSSASIPDERLVRLAKIPDQRAQVAIAAAIIRHGQVVWTGVAGEQDSRKPADTNTLFNVASLPNRSPLNCRSMSYPPHLEWLASKHKPMPAGGQLLRASARRPNDQTVRALVLHAPTRSALAGQSADERSRRS